MSTDEPHTIVSVRGEAHRSVPPDRAVLRCHVSWQADDASDARTGLTGRLADLRSNLDGMGATVSTPDTERDPLTYAVAAVYVGETWFRKRARRTASTSVTVSVRDLTRLSEVMTVVAGDDHISVSTSWEVDEDNPAWREIRAEAVHVALERGRDYAAALDGRIVGVEQIADAGLLSGAGGGEERGRAFALAAAAPGGAGGAEEELRLDPVPQHLSAVVDARLTAVLPGLPGD